MTPYWSRGLCGVLIYVKISLSPLRLDASIFRQPLRMLGEISIKDFCWNFLKKQKKIRTILDVYVYIYINIKGNVKSNVFVEPA